MVSYMHAHIHFYFGFLHEDMLIIYILFCFLFLQGDNDEKNFNPPQYASPKKHLGNIKEETQD